MDIRCQGLLADVRLDTLPDYIVGPLDLAKWLKGAMIISGRDAVDVSGPLTSSEKAISVTIYFPKEEKKPTESEEKESSSQGDDSAEEEANECVLTWFPTLDPTDPVNLAAALLLDEVYNSYDPGDYDDVVRFKETMAQLGWTYTPPKETPAII